MNQKNPSKPSASKAPLTGKESNPDSADFAFGKVNYQLMAVSVIMLVIGYMLMAGGKQTDPTVFNDAVFSFRRITLAPIVVIAGFAVAVYAIIKKAD